MPRKIQCSSCQKRYLVDDDAIGKQIKCKVCGTVFTIPELPDFVRELLEDTSDDDAPASDIRPAPRPSGRQARPSGRQKRPE